MRTGCSGSAVLSPGSACTVRGKAAAANGAGLTGGSTAGGLAVVATFGVTGGCADFGAGTDLTGGGGSSTTCAGFAGVAATGAEGVTVELGAGG